MAYCQMCADKEVEISTLRNKLCAENERLREENDNLSSHVGAMNEEMLRIETFMKGNYMNEIVATPTYGSISSATIYDIYRRRAGKEGG